MASLPLPRELLPPLLACLPTAFVSPRPPPALLPLLSPILRQRLQYASGGTSGSDGWLSLLSWDGHRAAKLAEKVEVLQLEPHPVSGELEIEDVTGIQYRRLDEETLHVRFELEQFDLLPIYVWCESDTQAEDAGPGWKLAELRALEDTDDGTEWFSTIQEANEAATTYKTSQRSGLQPPPTSSHINGQEEAQDDDDDYWASYDRTPGRTPAAHSPAPQALQQTRSAAEQADADDAYYSRYTTVQPAMDAHDPDEELSNPAQPSTSTQHEQAASRIPTPPSQPSYQCSLYPSDPNPQPQPAQSQQVFHPHAPRPISPASSTHSRKSIEKLEQHASTHSAAEAGVRTFIGSEVRNLFRLARSVGLEAGEFESLVKRELEVVGMLEEA